MTALLRRLCFASCLFAFVAPLAQAQKQQIFFGPIDTINGRDLRRPNPGAYMDLFRPGAPWQQSGARVDVFQVSTQFVIAATDQDLVTVFTEMKRRDIPMAISMGAAEREPGCGAGEGYMPANIVDLVGKRLTRHGFKLDIMEMDEPIWFAHEVHWGLLAGHTPCAYPLPRLVQQVAATVKHLRQYFPDLKVGDIEVVADYADRKDMNFQAVTRDYIQFSRMFERATGTKLAFFHSDIAWRTNWRPTFLILAKAFREEGIRFGAVIGGTPRDLTDQAFEQTGLNALRDFESNPATRLDDVLIESWQPRPSKYLPETEFGTSTNLLLRAEQMLAGPR